VHSKHWLLEQCQSENLCSLREGKDRLAVSVIWTVDPDNDFEVLDVWSGRTIIRSRHQMSYAQAQAILDGQPLCEGWEIDGGPGHLAQLQSDLRNLATFSQIQSEIDMTIYSEDTVIDEQSRATSHKDFIYKEHLSANAIEEGTANGDLRIGIFHASKYTPDEGFVRPSNKGEASLLEILVPGRKLQNRALHGDLVAVHVFVSGNAEKQKSVELDDGSIDGETLNVAQNGSSHYGVHESLNLVGDDEEEHENHPVTVKHGVIKGEIVGIIQGPKEIMWLV